MTRVPRLLLGGVVAAALKAAQSVQKGVSGTFLVATYRDVKPRPGELDLYGPRKDLVSSR